LYLDRKNLTYVDSYSSLPWPPYLCLHAYSLGRRRFVQLRIPAQERLYHNPVGFLALRPRLRSTPFRDSRCTFSKGRVTLVLYLMTALAKKLKIFYHVVSVIVVSMMNYPHPPVDFPQIFCATLAVSSGLYLRSKAVSNVPTVLVVGIITTFRDVATFARAGLFNLAVPGTPSSGSCSVFALSIIFSGCPTAWAIFAGRASRGERTSTRFTFFMEHSCLLIGFFFDNWLQRKFL
jgi:hypothetical protein